MDLDTLVAEWYRAASPRCSSNTIAGVRPADHCAPCKHIVEGWRLVHPASARMRLDDGRYVCRLCPDHPIWECTSKEHWNLSPVDGFYKCGGCGAHRHYEPVEESPGGSARSNATEDAMLRVVRRPIGSALSELERGAAEQRIELQVYLTHAVGGRSFAEIAHAAALRDEHGQFPNPAGGPWDLPSVHRAAARTRGRLRKLLGLRAPKRAFGGRASKQADTLRISTEEA